MKKTLNRSLSLLLALVLAVSLAVPALAADEPVTLDQTIMRCDSDSGKKLIKSMVLRTADRQGMC